MGYAVVGIQIRKVPPLPPVFPNIFCTILRFVTRGVNHNSSKIKTNPMFETEVTLKAPLGKFTRLLPSLRNWGYEYSPLPGFREMMERQQSCVAGILKLDSGIFPLWASIEG